MIQFDEKTHTYTLAGTELPSVTTICRFLAYDYKSDRPWLAEAAARRGTAIHEACALIDYGEEPEETPEIAGYLTAYRRFLRDYRPEWRGIERPLGDLLLGFAGTPDRFGIIGGRRVLVDIKTGRLHVPAVSAQLWGYETLLATADFDAIQADYALRLDKSGIYELRPIDPSYPLFTACSLLHDATTTKKGPLK